VRSLAEAVRRDHGRLDVLVNSAGIGSGGPPGRREQSPDGHELRFAVNYLAGYLLTRLLLPVLKASEPSRIVNVASLGQQPLEFDDVMLTKDYSGWRAYCQSKLAQILFTIDLAEELGGARITANCVHPATFMNTTMVRESGVAPMSTVEEGCEAILNLVLGEGLGSGKFFNGLRPARANEQAYDPQARRQLGELSAELAGI
jgi:NAD(P)-dependent dehydrogenase (short-subunit alcohol dehydrogenase family)